MSIYVISYEFRYTSNRIKYQDALGRITDLPSRHFPTTPHVCAVCLLPTNHGYKSESRRPTKPTCLEEAMAKLPKFALTRNEKKDR